MNKKSFIDNDRNILKYIVVAGPLNGLLDKLSRTAATLLRSKSQIIQFRAK